jgi:hypothetical protein
LVSIEDQFTALSSNLQQSTTKYTHDGCFPLPLYLQLSRYTEFQSDNGELRDDVEDLYGIPPRRLQEVSPQTQVAKSNHARDQYSVRLAYPMYVANGIQRLLPILSTPAIKTQKL